MFAHSGAKVQSQYFYLGDLVTSTGGQDIRSVPRRLSDYLEELACMLITSTICRHLGSSIGDLKTTLQDLVHNC